MLSTASKSLSENKPFWKYGESSFTLLNISSFSKISWTAKAAATAIGIPEYVYPWNNSIAPFGDASITAS